MKVVAFNGSARKDGNTAILVNVVFKELKKAGIKTELVQLAGKRSGDVPPAENALRTRISNARSKEMLPMTVLTRCWKRMESSLHHQHILRMSSPEIKALIDRSGFVAKANQDMFKRKVGAGVIAVRRCGGIHAFDTINHFFFINQMIVRVLLTGMLVSALLPAM